MADFNALEALINAHIKKNGVQAITGNILNGILRGMVSALGKGYTIAGVAIPSSDPGTMTGPLAYLAYTAGTYTHFGGLEVEQGEVAMLIYNEALWHKEVLFSLAANATIDANVGTPSVGVSFVDGLLTFDFHNMKGNPGVDGEDGEAAGFGTVNATVDANVGTPGVSVQSSGPDTAKNITFQFTNLKGETGVTSVVVTVDNTSGTPSCAVSLQGQQLTLAFTGLKGAQGNTGVSADYPIAIINNLTTDDPASALSAAQGVVLEGEVSQLRQQVIGPARIDGETESWKEELTLTFTDGSYKAVQSAGTVISTNSAGSLSLVEFPANAGDIIEIQLYQVVSSANYVNYFIPAVNDSTAAIVGNDIPNYLELVDSDNAIYHLTCPTGTTKVFSAVSINHKDAFGAWKLWDGKELKWLEVKESNLEQSVQNKINNPQVQSVGPNQIDGTEQDISKEDITISFIDGSYKTVNNGTPPTISTSTNATFSTIVVPASEGDIVELKLTLDIGAQYNTYTIFAVSDTVGAVKGNEISSYVTLLDGTNHIYRLTCPAGTTKIFSTCKTADKSTVWAKKVIRKKELKWLEVKESNIDTSAVSSIVSKAETATLATIEEDGKKYHLWDSIKKKFDFTGKTLVAFGDSITSGVSSPGLVTITDCYIKLFCDYAGVSNLNNRAISGQPLVYVGNTYSVYERVLAFHSVADVIVIAGGTNDWNQGQPIGTWGSSDNTTVYGALKGICEYLQTNYPDAYVVFITPIPYTKPVSAYPNHIAPLDEYRSAIYDVATYYGYSVVSGLDLGMPREQGGWNNTMCDDTDGCHPTALGHALFARSLAGKLL